MNSEDDLKLREKRKSSPPLHWLWTHVLFKAPSVPNIFPVISWQISGHTDGCHHHSVEVMMGRRYKHKRFGHILKLKLFPLGLSGQWKEKKNQLKMSFCCTSERINTILKQVVNIYGLTLRCYQIHLSVYPKKGTSGKATCSILISETGAWLKWSSKSCKKLRPFFLLE